MHVLYQMKVPVEIAQRLDLRLRSLRTEFEREAALLDKKIAASNDPARLDSLNEAMQEKLHVASRLRIHNLIRLALEIGVSGVEKMSKDEIYAWLIQSGIAMGRPREPSTAIR